MTLKSEITKIPKSEEVSKRKVISRGVHELGSLKHDEYK